MNRILFQVGHVYQEYKGRDTSRAIFYAAKRLSTKTIIWQEVEPGIFEKQGIRYTESDERIPGNTYVYLNKRYRMDLAGAGEKKILEFNGALEVAR